MSGKVAALAVFVILIGSACSQSGSTGQTTPGQIPTSSPAASVPSASASPIAKATCTVPLPDSWRSQVQAANVPLPTGSRVIPFAAGTDTSAFFAELYSVAWSGVVSIKVPSGELKRIAAFKDPAIDQAYSGGFDGRWLVWVELLSQTNWNDWQIWAWDSATNQAFQIGAPATANGQPVSGPFEKADVSDGRAAWVQANQAGTGDVHLYSLLDRHDQVIESGAIDPVAFWGSDLIWQHLDVPGQSGHLKMIDASTGQPVSVPEPLASVRHLAFLAVSNDLVSWTDGQSIWAYRSQNPIASLVYEQSDHSASYLAIAGDLITWAGSMGPVALDLRSSSVASLTGGNGDRVARDNALVIYWPESKTPSVSTPFFVSVVDASKLPALPSC